METKLAARSSPLRCLYCHDSVDEGRLRTCGCGAVYHADCLKEIGRCATLGCAARLEGMASAPAVAEVPARPIAGVNMRAPLPREPWVERLGLDRGAFVGIFATLCGVGTSFGAFALAPVPRYELSIALTLGMNAFIAGVLGAHVIWARSKLGLLGLVALAVAVVLGADYAAEQVGAHSWIDTLFMTIPISPLAWLVGNLFVAKGPLWSLRGRYRPPGYRL